MSKILCIHHCVHRLTVYIVQYQRPLMNVLPSESNGCHQQLCTQTKGEHHNSMLRSNITYFTYFRILVHICRNISWFPPLSQWHLKSLHSSHWKCIEWCWTELEGLFLGVSSLIVYQCGSRTVVVRVQLLLAFRCWLRSKIRTRSTTESEQEQEDLNKIDKEFEHDQWRNLNKINNRILLFQCGVQLNKIVKSHKN